MKKHLIAFLLLTAPLFFPASAQELKIKSFELNIQSAVAKTNPRRDNNGEECALVRVYVALQGATFAEYLIGDVVTPRPSEYWVYMPAGTRWIQVNHPDYLPFRYEFSERLQPGRTYDLYLLLPEKPSGPVLPEMNSQFLALTVTPRNAMVLVDDMPRNCVDGTLSLELAFGTHTYLASAPMYHTQKGEFTISPSGTTRVDVVLKEAFGHVNISSLPESGAQVLIDGEARGTTPCRLKLESGTYSVQVVKSGYIAYAQTVAVADGQTANVAASMKANFSQVTLKAPNPEAEIWVSGKKYGVGFWRGRLDAGTYSVESRCEGYEPAKDVVTVEPAVPRTYTLTAQLPIYGLLKVTSTPMGATVKVDGRAVGTTPFMSNQVLTGTHNLEVAATGYLPHKETFSLLKDGRKEYEVTLEEEPLLTMDNLFPIYGITLGKTTIKDMRGMGYAVKTDSDRDSVCHVHDINFWDFDSDSVFEQIYMSYSDPMPGRWQKLGFAWGQPIETWRNLFEKSGYTVTYEENKYSSEKEIDLTAVSKDDKLEFRLEFRLDFSHGRSPYSINVDVKPDKSSQTTASTSYRSSTTTSASASMSSTATSSSGYYVGQDIGVGYVISVDATGKHGLIVAKNYGRSTVQNFGFLDGGGNYDWRLPSSSELNLVYKHVGSHYPAGWFLSRETNPRSIYQNKKDRMATYFKTGQSKYLAGTQSEPYYVVSVAEF